MAKINKNRNGGVRLKLPNGKSQRFSSQAEAQRVQLLVQYVNFCSNAYPKMTYEALAQMLLADFKTVVAMVAKIEGELARGEAEKAENVIKQAQEGAENDGNSSNDTKD